MQVLPHQLRHQRPYAMDSELFSVFSVRKTENCRMGVHSVFEFKKRGGGRIGRSLFVNPKGSWAQPKSQSGFGSQAVPDLQGCAVLALLGEGSKAGPMQRWTMLRGGLPFYLTKLPNPVPMQRSCCVCAVHNMGRHGLLWHNARCFWATVCEEKTCIHLNCLIMLQDELSMLNGPQTSCVYFQACWSSHLTCSLFKCLY